MEGERQKPFFLYLLVVSQAVAVTTVGAVGAKAAAIAVVG